MANFPSFGLTLEEKSSLQTDIDNLVTEAHSILKVAGHPTDHDYSAALYVLTEAITVAKDLLDGEVDDDDEDDDQDDDQDQKDATTRRYALGKSLADAHVLRGDILRAQGQIPEALHAYTEVISRYPDTFPHSNAHAPLTSSTSSPPTSTRPRTGSLIPRPTTSPGPDDTKTRRSSHRRKSQSPPPNAANRAWKAVLELSQPQGPKPYPPLTSDNGRVSAAWRNSTPSNNAALSKREKRRAGVWNAGYQCESGAPSPSPTVAEARQAMVERKLDELRRDTKPDVRVQEVWARKQVRIVERDEDSSDSSASSASVGADRSIQHKKKYEDLRSQARRNRGKTGK